MFALRCTKKLLTRVEKHGTFEREPQPTTTRLGDWTATLVIIERQQLVLAISAVTLLPVVLPLAPARTLVSRFPDAVREVLVALGVAPLKVELEHARMKSLVLAPTNDRRVLGSLNDFSRMIDVWLDGRPWVEVALKLADAPCSPIGMQSPDDLTRKEFV